MKNGYCNKQIAQLVKNRSQVLENTQERIHSMRSMGTYVKPHHEATHGPLRRNMQETTRFETTFWEEPSACPLNFTQGISLWTQAFLKFGSINLLVSPCL